MAWSVWVQTLPAVDSWHPPPTVGSSCSGLPLPQPSISRVLCRCAPVSRGVETHVLIMGAESWVRWGLGCPCGTATHTDRQDQRDDCRHQAYRLPPPQRPETAAAHRGAATSTLFWTRSRSLRMSQLNSTPPRARRSALVVVPFPSFFPGMFVGIEHSCNPMLIGAGAGRVCRSVPTRTCWRR